jgi:CDP-diacylglycerol--glycerol-3-phosphate 3-phosphatidyltransferase
MPSVYDLKPAFVRLLDPLVVFCVRRGVTPNAVTGAALALSLAMGALLAIFPASRAVQLGVALSMLVRMALNAIDGAVARRAGQSSAAGELFNETSDVVADAALYLPLIVVSWAPPTLVFLFVLITGWTEFFGVLPKVVGRTRRYQGPMGKSDRALLVGLYLAALAVGAPHGGWELALFAAADVLLAVTCVRRLLPAH